MLNIKNIKTRNKKLLSPNVDIDKPLTKLIKNQEIFSAKKCVINMAHQEIALQSDNSETFHEIINNNWSNRYDEDLKMIYVTFNILAGKYADKFILEIYYVLSDWGENFKYALVIFELILNDIIYNLNNTANIEKKFKINKFEYYKKDKMALIEIIEI